MIINYLFVNSDSNFTVTVCAYLTCNNCLQEERSRVEIFREYSMRKREPVCGQFLNLLNGSDGFIINMSARIIAKVACWGSELMESSDLQFYLTWLKDQLKLNVSIIF